VASRSPPPRGSWPPPRSSETWLGLGLAALVVVASGWLLARAARGPDWGVAHVAAVATGVLLSRGALAFLYYPVVGETSAERKYAHNVVMLLIVAAAGAYAIRRARSSRSVAP
jgi:drug/metabolite transporter (DMT)-like permease